MKKAEKNLTILQEVDSTNNYANRLIMTDSAEDGAVVLAHYQKKGKGQSGNHWESEAGKNILASVILFPTFLPADQQFYLSKVTSLALLDFFKPEINNISIKWPNDIYVENNKIAGILIENSVKGNFMNTSILGMGININQHQFSAGIPNPVSLKQITGKSYDIEKLLHHLLKHLFNWYEKLKQHQLQEIDDKYLLNLYRLNQWSRFKKEEQVFEARIFGIDEIGRLLLEDRKGFHHSFMFKEVEFII